MIVLSAFALGNVHLMLLSVSASPTTRRQARAWSAATTPTIGWEGNRLLDSTTIINPFMGAGALQSVIDDFQRGRARHRKAGYIGGGAVSCSSTGGRPIQFHPVPHGTPRWGSD